MTLSPQATQARTRELIIDSEWRRINCGAAVILAKLDADIAATRAKLGGK